MCSGWLKVIIPHLWNAKWRMSYKYESNKCDWTNTQSCTVTQVSRLAIDSLSSQVSRNQWCGQRIFMFSLITIPISVILSEYRLILASKHVDQDLSTFLCAAYLLLKKSKPTIMMQIVLIMKGSIISDNCKIGHQDNHLI